MSLRINSTCLAALLAMAFMTPLAQAQREIHHVPPVVDPDGYNVDLLHPFADLDTFQSDYQWFAPAEFGEFGGGDPPSTGWFATYDRVYLYMSRPDYDILPQTGDWTWGNRFSLGYMSEEDHGWFSEIWRVGGPNYYDIVTVERVNVLEPDDEINGDPNNVDLRGGGGGGGGTPAANPQRFGVPERDRNDPVTEARDYRLHDSINVATLSSFELNKSFRWKQLHYGATFEPFFGFRYMSYQDLHRRDEYARIDGTTGVIVGQFPPTTQDPNDLDDELFTTIQSRFDNHLVGGQLGGRIFKNKGRWLLSSEIRAFAFANFQYLETTTLSELTFYGAVGVDEAPEGVFYDSARTAGTANEFAFGGEIRAEAAYELTRDLSVRFGGTVMLLDKGIGRGDNIANNTEDVTMYGMTMGLDYRR